MKKCVLKNFAKFTGKHLCQSLFFHNVAGLSYVSNFTKKETLAAFSCGLCKKISQNTYFKDDLQTTVSESSYVTASNDTCSVKKYILLSQ